MDNLKQEYNDFIETLPSRVGETPKDVIFNWWTEKMKETYNKGRQSIIDEVREDRDKFLGGFGYKPKK